MYVCIGHTHVLCACVLHISRRLELCQLRIHVHTHTHTHTHNTQHTTHNTTHLIFHEIQEAVLQPPPEVGANRHDLEILHLASQVTSHKAICPLPLTPFRPKPHPSPQACLIAGSACSWHIKFCVQDTACCGHFQIQVRMDRMADSSMACHKLSTVSALVYLLCKATI
jgi:hypothetical protein